MKKIIYVAPHLNEYGIRLKPSPLFPDVVAIDWQLRLLSYLVELEYNVLVKQHPETKTKMHPYFFKQIGVKNLEGKFEKVIKSSDLLIFDSVATTTFGFALRQGNPIVLIDFNFLILKPKERELLRNRIEIVEGFFGHNNRADIEWGQFSESLDKCLISKDTTYQKTILGQ